jgi:hypothetical protein
MLDGIVAIVAFESSDSVSKGAFGNPVCLYFMGFFLEMLCDIPHIHGVTTAGRHYPRTSEAFRGSCITMPFPQSSRCGNTFAFASTIYVVTNYNLNCS